MNRPLDAGDIDARPDETVSAWVDAALASPDPIVADAVGRILERRDAIEAEWADLCSWDPELPPDAATGGPAYLVTAIAGALTRPQPIGWGLDPALVRAARDLAANVTTPEHAVAQLVCLGHVLDRQIVDAVQPADRIEVLRRLHMITARLIAHTVREATHQLRTLAFVDPLTGLPNRRAFEDDFGREVSRARRHGHPLSLAVIDIDGLKRVNDTAGHGAGDELLRSVAAMLRSALRHEDVAYRIGGDEFAIVLPAIDVRDDGAFLRSRLQVDAPFSLGVASSLHDPVDRLFELADSRLYDGRRRRRG